jgi:hypothetical protein
VENTSPICPNTWLEAADRASVTAAVIGANCWLTCAVRLLRAIARVACAGPNAADTTPRAICWVWFNVSTIGSSACCRFVFCCCNCSAGVRSGSFLPRGAGMVGTLK